MKFATDATVQLRVIDVNTTSNVFIKTFSVKRKGNPEIQENVSIIAKIDLQTKITANKKLTPSGIICAL